MLSVVENMLLPVAGYPSVDHGPFHALGGDPAAPVVLPALQSPLLVWPLDIYSSPQIDVVVNNAGVHDLKRTRSIIHSTCESTDNHSLETVKHDEVTTQFFATSAQRCHQRHQSRALDPSCGKVFRKEKKIVCFLDHEDSMTP